MLDWALIGIVFLPLLAACACVVLGPRPRLLVVAATHLLLPVLLLPLTLAVSEQGTLIHALGGFSPPLGIRLLLDPLALVMLWLTVLVMGLCGWHALTDYHAGEPAAAHFWPLWLLLLAGMNALFLSGDLFNLYVCIELVTLAAIPLIALNDSPDALRAAMRYLLLALLASLAYLLGVALIYNAAGTLDLHLLTRQAADQNALRVALALVSTGLLLKAAVFPLHVWLPPAHGNAPGAVSAVLSALVVKTGLYLLYRIWYWSGVDALVIGDLMAALGVGALLYGGVGALLQRRLKLVIAYSTVAQLGYLLLVFALHQQTAWQGTLYQLISHGLAKAALFLAAANVLHAFGQDDIDRIGRLDQRQPLTLFAMAIAAVSIMGLPPSGGFLAKWLLLQAAWQGQHWLLLTALLVGSLLAAGYMFRMLAAALQPHDAAADAGHHIPLRQELPALLLALAALALGLASAPILSLLEQGMPGGLLP